MQPGGAFLPVIHPTVMVLSTVASMSPQEGDQAVHTMMRDSGTAPLPSASTRQGQKGLLHRLVSRSTEANLAPQRPPPSLARHRGQGPGSGVPLDARQALWCAQANTDRLDETQQPPPASIRIGVMSRTSTSPRLRLASSVICTCVTHGLDMGTNRIRSMMRTASSATLEPTLCHSHAAGRSRLFRTIIDHGRGYTFAMGDSPHLPFTKIPLSKARGRLSYDRGLGRRGRERARRIGVATAGLAQSRQCQLAEKLQVSISSRRESTVERLMGGDPRLPRRSGQDMLPMPAPAPTVRCPTQAPHESHAGLHTTRPVPRSINHTLPTSSINGLKHAGSMLVTVQTCLWCQAPSVCLDPASAPQPALLVQPMAILSYSLRYKVLSHCNVHVLQRLCLTPHHTHTRRQSPVFPSHLLVRSSGLDRMPKTPVPLIATLEKPGSVAPYPLVCKRLPSYPKGEKRRNQTILALSPVPPFGFENQPGDIIR
ncbi:predicted protein [Verticillium alfalfae VaMs.102]|uniref:Predicted protein n=1 Tax=Verticillium alfalfae (strain VaMs.102 / ATCC MYA-4576 / FGSC 10136) TaxID=526221 RepID=C9S6G3_VERA1|nr:predicted protein [Verticillium alfalfae VaMs.102]EEY15150.1 predicted protein [Verticillium alfalfae VaMs.102]